MICEKHLVGLLLCIFVKKNLVTKINDVRTCSTGVGIMGVLGNKGGIGVSMNIYDSNVCFISSHLAAHTENVEGRNLDFKNIIERSVFPSENDGFESEQNESRSVDDVSNYFFYPFSYLLIIFSDKLSRNFLSFFSFLFVFFFFFFQISCFSSNFFPQILFVGLITFHIFLYISFSWQSDKFYSSFSYSTPPSPFSLLP